jgi:hypothetical protein
MLLAIKGAKLQCDLDVLELHRRLVFIYLKINHFYNFIFDVYIALSHLAYGAQSGQRPYKVVCHYI